MIDLAKEKVLSLRDAAAYLPPRRHGKRPHRDTLARWGKNGYHGVFLEVVQVGDTACTSAEALQRFVEAVTASVRARSPATNSPAKPRRDEEEIEEQLKNMGM